MPSNNFWNTIFNFKSRDFIQSNAYTKHISWTCIHLSHDKLYLIRWMRVIIVISIRARKLYIQNTHLFDVLTFFLHWFFHISHININRFAFKVLDCLVQMYIIEFCELMIRSNVFSRQKFSKAMDGKIEIYNK